jgi:beta-galactosidase/beta-glucuronidase
MTRASISTVLIFGLALGLLPATVQAQPEAWQPADGPLMTRWADDVDPANPLPEYPRPKMERDQWTNLNGLWDFQISGKRGKGEYDDQILVPYPVESALSGVMESVGAENRVWYRRTVDVAPPAEDERVLLHFGASDWETNVFVNDQHVGMHQGGYDPFTFDITDALAEEGTQTIEVTVWDPTDKGHQPVGKQTHDPRSIWYTAVTGLWQTVWLERVPAAYIKDLKVTPQVDQERAKIEVEANEAPDGYQVRAVVSAEGDEVARTTGRPHNRMFVAWDDPQRWSPDNPFLYDLEVELLDDEGNVVDQVSSYIGMRSVSVAEAEDGHVRLFLNDEPLFHLGPLDQGWWPDGLYTAPTDAALRYDIEMTKELGYNMLRKHVKVEPQRFYYWADRLGILVWQDMPSGDMRPGQIPTRTPESAAQFKQEYQAMIEALYHYPSIVMWVPFNEGWGQFQTEEIVAWTEDYDPTRLVNNASGWTDRGVGDVIDEHHYPGPDMPEPEDNRAAVLGEFGGEALVVEDHLWIQDFSRAPSHYETSQSEEALHAAYDGMIEELGPMKTRGLAAAVYTQTTDVESEVNGLMTYDRAVVKFDEAHMRQIHSDLIRQPIAAPGGADPEEP